MTPPHRIPGAAAGATPADPLLRSLRQALPALGFDARALRLERLPDKGLAHDHVRLVGHGLLARVPKQSQLGLGAEANLRYQAACFERAAASGHAPRLHGLIAPRPGSPLQRGALLVEEIIGTPAPLPAALGAIVDALAAIHRLPLPDAPQRAPLIDEPDALAALAREIDAQAVHLDAAGLASDVRTAIAETMNRWRATVAQPLRPPRRLITFDAHPGNFLIRADRRAHALAGTPADARPGWRGDRPADARAAANAVIVDLEKARYSHPPLDLAHATLYTSTTWDLQSRAVLPLLDVVAACERWLAAMGSGDPWREWLVPLREAMWLWALTWCAKWRVLSRAAGAAGADGEDWSAERSDAALIEHVRGRVDEYLSSAGVEFVLGECVGLRRQFGSSEPSVARLR